MTTYVDPSDTLLGLPVLMIKALLTSFHHGTRTPEKLGHRAGVKLAPPIVTAILGECLQRGMIEEDPCSDWRQFRLSLTGQGLIYASSGRRHTRDTGERVLDGLLERCSSLNSDRNAPGMVTKVWVFGSYLDRCRPDLGDLDVVIERSFSETGSALGFSRFMEHISEFYPEVTIQRNDAVKSYRLWFQKMLYGKRRHSMIAEVDVGVLKGMHVPCALMFDVAQGGRIEPQYFEHHPLSLGREDWVNDRVLMPDFKNVLPGFDLTPAVVLSRLFTDPKSILPEEIVFSDKQLPKQQRKLLDGRKIDGLGSFLFVYRQAGTEATVLLKREVDFKDDEWRYSVTLELLQYRKSPYGPQKMLLRLMAIAEHLISADVFRLDHHRRTQGLSVPIRLESQWAENSFAGAPLPTFHNFDLDKGV